jgi:hypothetical protein
MPQPDGWGRAYCSVDKGSSIDRIIGGSDLSAIFEDLKGLGHEKEFKYFDKN